MVSLYVNLFLYIGYTWYSWKKVPSLTIHNMLSIWITIIAGIGIYSVQFGYYQRIYGDSLTFPIEAYIFGFIAFLITMWPFRLLNDENFQIKGLDDSSDKIIIPLMKFLMIPYTVYFLILAQAAIYSLQFDPVDIYRSQHYEGETLYKFSSLETTFNYYINTIFNVVNPIFIYVSLYNLTKSSRHRILCLYQLCLTCMIQFASCVMTGQRGGVFVFCALLGIIAIPFWKDITIGNKTLIKKVGVLFMSLFALYTIAMTISRFDGSNAETPIEGIVRYFGEPFPNMGAVLWDKVRINPMGLRLYPYFFNIKNIASGASSLTDELYAWETVTGVPMYIFKTEYGDFYIEFGKYLGLLAMFIYSLFFRLFIRNRSIELSAIPIFYFFLDIAVSSPMDFAKRYLFHQRVLFLCIVLYFILHYYFKKKTKA